MTKKWLDRIDRSLDGDLPPDEARRLQDALEDSEPIRRTSAGWSVLRETLRGGSVHSFPPGFADRVMRNLEKEADARNNGDSFLTALSGMFRPLAVGAALLILGLLFYNMLNRGEMTWAGAFAQPRVTAADALDPAMDYFWE